MLGAHCLVFIVWMSLSEVWDLGYGVQGLGLRVGGWRFRVTGLK